MKSVKENLLGQVFLVRCFGNKDVSFARYFSSTLKMVFLCSLVVLWSSVCCDGLFVLSFIT